MLYLAEVKKQTQFIGKPKTELKLLACQRNDQSWSAIPGEEIIAAEEATNFADGALVMANINNKQVQGTPEAASGQLVGLLQNFSRILGKAKDQEEEIEQWKQSLTLQSQELSRWQMEMESRQEQLAKMEEEVAHLEQERHKVERFKQEAEKLKAECERKEKDLQGAWSHLKAEQERLEDKKATVLEQGQINQIKQLLDRLTLGDVPVDSLHDNFNQVLDLVTQQQSQLSLHWQELEREKGKVKEHQITIERKNGDLQARRQELQEAQGSLEKAKIQLQVQQNILESKKETLRLLNLHLENKEDLQQTISRLGSDSSNIQSDHQINIESVENMPLNELEETVANLKEKLNKLARFVGDQEEELSYGQQAIAELQTKLSQASEMDRINLESEIADEQASQQMLEESIRGSRRNLRDQEYVFKQHLRILKRRQGTIDTELDEGSINLGPLIAQLAEQSQQQEQERQNVDAEIEQIKKSIQQVQEMIQQQQHEQEHRQQECQRYQDELQGESLHISQLEVKVKLYEEMLQPLQNSLTEVYQKLKTLQPMVTQMRENRGKQEQALQEVQANLGTLLNSQQ
jgi:chromosome segregation ATPase